MTACAACPVLQGECPRCLTFWIRDKWTDKRYGVMRVESPALQAIQPDGSTVHLPWLDEWPNVMVKR